jgi:hypothetical protein
VTSGPPQRSFTRTHLFLVRISTRVTDGGAGDEADPVIEDGGDATINLEWRGTVQRTVDGEAHQFSSWQALVDLLQGMLSSKKGR